MKNVNVILEQERVKVAQRISELEQLNAVDTEKLKAMRDDYSTAVFDNSTDGMDEINNSIKKVTESITERKSIISTLSASNNPIVQRAALEGVEQSASRLKSIEQEVATMVKDLTPVHSKLVNGLAKLNELRIEVIGLDNDMSKFYGMLNVENQEQTPLHSHDLRTGIAVQLNNLLVQHWGMKV